LPVHAARCAFGILTSLASTYKMRPRYKPSLLRTLLLVRRAAAGGGLLVNCHRDRSTRLGPRSRRRWCVLRQSRSPISARRVCSGNRPQDHSERAISLAVQAPEIADLDALQPKTQRRIHRLSMARRKTTRFSSAGRCSRPPTARQLRLFTSECR